MERKDLETIVPKNKQIILKEKINGKVLSEDNLPLEFASVTLINKRWDKVIEGQLQIQKESIIFLKFVLEST